MSLKNIYFVANWKMHGSINSSHLVKKIRNFSNKNAKLGKSKIILCVPYLFISLFKNILKNLVLNWVHKMFQMYLKTTELIQAQLVRECLKTLV